MVPVLCTINKSYEKTKASYERALCAYSNSDQPSVSSRSVVSQLFKTHHWVALSHRVKDVLIIMNVGNAVYYDSIHLTTSCCCKYSVVGNDYSSAAVSSPLQMHNFLLFESRLLKNYSVVLFSGNYLVLFKDAVIRFWPVAVRFTSTVVFTDPLTRWFWSFRGIFVGTVWRSLPWILFLKKIQACDWMFHLSLNFNQSDPRKDSATGRASSHRVSWEER